MCVCTCLKLNEIKMGPDLSGNRWEWRPNPRGMVRVRPDFSVQNPFALAARISL